MESDTAQLVEAVRRSQPGAIDDFVDCFYAGIYAFLRRLTGNETDAADLTQKVFARVWSALPRFAGRSSVGSWLHAIAYHVYQDSLRSNHRLESRPESWWLERTDPAPGPDARVADADLAATVYAAVEALDAARRETVHLHYYQGLTLDETAEVLGVATSTVKYRLREALRLVQGRLTDSSFPVPPSNLTSTSRP
jgi:RNA polymerase sigma-70 factor (ECF subfamily)